MPASRPYIADYAGQLQLPAPALAPLFVLCWARYVASQLGRLGDAGERFGPQTANWLRANRYYALWRYAVTHIDDLDWPDPPRTTRSI